jgi:integrase
MTAAEIRDMILQDKGHTRIDFLQFARDYATGLEQAGRKGSAKPTRGMIHNLEKYTARLYFGEITADWLRGFERYLIRSGLGRSANNYMRYLRLVFNAGRDKYNDDDRGVILIPNYPFKRYKIPKPATSAQENALTADQVRRLFTMPTMTQREALAVDVCRIMILLMGINGIDLYGLKRTERGRVVYNRSKTGHPFKVKIEPELLEVLKRRKGMEYLFPFAEHYSTHEGFIFAVNQGLAYICKRIHKEAEKAGKRADWPEPITTNWIRHTWATIARNDCGVDKDDVALCLGHKDNDNRVTDKYIRYDYTIQDNTNRKVIDLLF